MSKRKPQFDFWTIVTIGILAVFALFLIYPLISLFVDGFLEEGTGAFTMANFTKFFGKKFYYRWPTSCPFSKSGARASLKSSSSSP